MSTRRENKINNGLFGGTNDEEVKQLRDNAPPDGKIRLSSSVATDTKEILPIAEALVAVDTKTGNILKFLSAFIPPHPGVNHYGIKFLITRTQTDPHKPIFIMNTGAPLPPGKFWNPNSLTSYLDYGRLPMTCEHAEFRVLRAYKQGLRVPHRFEIIAFKDPLPGEYVEKRDFNTFYVERAYNHTQIPPIRLDICHRQMYWWQCQILQELGSFAGVNLMSRLGLGISRRLDEAVAAGKMAEETKQEILHDHSEDPVEVSEPLATSFGITPNMKADEDEGRDFYVPDNPLVKNTKEDEEETVELLD